MYTLYFLPDACSLATHAILHELDLPITLINKQDVEDFTTLNPVGTVPVLVEKEPVDQQLAGNDPTSLREGVAILLHILSKHENDLLPANGIARQRAIENMAFANATMHPAYGRLFFAEHQLSEPEARRQVFMQAANAINKLWAVVETKLDNQPYLGGDHPSPADFMLAVYSRWGEAFQVNIQIGPNTSAMIKRVIARDSFQKALQWEADYKAAA
ncbi:glutathione S-transferase family protein [Pseudomaricurvus alkylphenolicus]|jgi:glutathione S-transferase|uniref:glutathione S-transferase family protein n=1 Tax=Pseudomaricurvus alkylphenolicus TaxID=1306991 RepID=UPI0014233B16|nr:glutathione S-transferase family protein [Pseudomaricurvus alkylphenolicus]NIB40765.1 glutathione S-transferase family protein [Pseudomaricurvus alkylphenolicus]